MPDDQTASGKEDTKPGSLPRASDRIRDSAKWILVTFAAVGATLIAGLQLADLGDLSNEGPEYRLTLAAVGVALGVLGVIIAIGASSSIVTKSFVTLKWLADQPSAHAAREGMDGDRALLGGFDTVEELRASYDKAMENRRVALKDHFDSPADAEKTKAAKAADDWAIALGKTQAHVLDQASFNNLRASYTRVRWAILFGAAITAVGIGIFAWAANPPETVDQAVVMPLPANVLVNIDTEDRGKFQPQLGENCDLSAVRAVALGATGESFQLATVPSEDCQATLITVAGSEASVVAEEDFTPGDPAPPNSGG